MGLYWLDASFFIHASKSLYAFDINESFWNWLDGQISEGRVAAPRRVYDEVTAHLGHQDTLAEWVRQRKNRGLRIEPDRKVQGVVRDITDYVFSGRWPVEEVWDFCRGADGLVIAHAKVDGGYVVTHESQKQPLAKKVRIPDVCHNFGVDCYDVPGFIRAMKAKL